MPSQHIRLRRGTPATLWILLSLLVFAATGTLAGDISIVRNSATPRDGDVHLQLEELWRAGDENDELLFGMITQVREDDAGRLYVMDAQLSDIHVFSPDGKHLDTLFGEGEGPGEIRGPRDFVLLDDGRVGAVQEVPGKMIFVDRDGVPAGTLTVGGHGTSHGGFCQTFSAFAGGDVLLLAGFIQSPGTTDGHMQQTSFLSRVDAEGVRTLDFARRIEDIAFADFTFDESRHMAPFWWNAGVDDAGRVYVAPDLNRYRIEVYAPDGAPLRVIERAYEPWMRTENDKQDFREMVEAVYHGAPFDIGVNPCGDEPVIVYLQRGLRVRRDGSLWVLTTRGTRAPGPGAMAAFDVFDPEGIYTRKVHVHGPWNGANDGVFLLEGDRAVVVTGFADAMYSQFTGGHSSVEMEDEAGTVEVVYCRVLERP